MIFNKKTISGLLVNSKLMIDAALSDDEIKGALAAYSYTEEVLNQGKDIYEKAEDLAEQKVRASGKKLAAANKFHSLRRQTQALFVEHLNFLRQAYRDEPEKLVEFNISGRIKRKVTDWLLQAKQFYSIFLSNEELITKLNRYGISREKVEAVRDQIIETIKAKETHNKCSGEAQNVKARRDRAFRKLDLWTAELALVCRYALKESPQLLEKLGIQVLSDGYRRKKKEPEIKTATEPAVEPALEPAVEPAAEKTKPAAVTAKKSTKKAAA